MEFSQDFVILCGASVRAAAEAARSHTKNIVGIDVFGDSDLRKICTHWAFLDRTDPAASIREALKECERMGMSCAGSSDPDTTPIPIIFTGGYESWGGQLRETIPQTGRLLAPAWDIVETLRSSDFLKSVAEKSGIRYPVTIARDSYEEFKRWDLPQALHASEAGVGGEQIRAWESECWLVKRTHSAGGLGVRYADSDHPTEDRGPFDEGRCLLQQYIPGIPIGANFISNGCDVEFLGANRSIIVPVGDLPFVYGGSFGMLRLEKAMELSMMTVARQVVLATGLRGLFGIDFQFRRSDKTLWLLEVNPRYTASMELVERASGMSLLGAHQQAYCDGNFDVCDFGNRLFAKSRLQNQCFIKKIIWAPTAAVWSRGEDAMRDYRDFQEALTPAIGNATPSDELRFVFADIPENGTKISAGQPVATLICRGPSWISIRRLVQQVERRLLSRIAVDG